MREDRQRNQLALDSSAELAIEQANISADIKTNSLIVVAEPEVQEVYVPSRPFVAPNSGTTAEYLEKLVTHYNSWANDNSMHGTRPGSITRYVLGPEETKAIAVHIAKQPSSTAKALLRELSKRINQADNDRTFITKRIYVEPKAEKLLDAVGKKFGLTLDFKGDPKAPKFDYY